MRPPAIKVLITGFALLMGMAKPMPCSLTPQLADIYDLPVDRGALVTRVETGGPAERVGLEPGDVITAAEGRPVKDLCHRVGWSRQRGIRGIHEFGICPHVGDDLGDLRWGTESFMLIVVPATTLSSVSVNPISVTALDEDP